MDYKDIYEEIRDALWGNFDGKKDDDAKEFGVGEGYILHKDVDSMYHKRVLRLFMKFADKLYLDTKDEYAIKILQEICGLVGDLHEKLDIDDLDKILGTADDPMFMFDGYKTDNVKEPKPEEKYTLLIRKTYECGNSDYNTMLFKYYEEAKAYFDHLAEEERKRDDSYHYLHKEFNVKLNDDYESVILIDDENHFKTERLELLLKKTD